MTRTATFRLLVVAFLASALHLSSYAATTFQLRTRNTKPITVGAPGLLGNNLGLTTAPLVVAQFRGSNTLTGITALGATVTINADGSFTYDPSTSTVLSTLPPGQTMQDQFDYKLAPKVAPLGGTTKVFFNVPEAKDYTLVYELPIPNVANFNGGTIPYTANNSAAAYPFNRVAYYIELQTASGTLQYAYASMDSFTTDLTKLGVPASQASAIFQQLVTNMNVVSNVSGIVTGTSLSTGNIEFWPNDYSQANALPVTNANGGNFDFGDTRSTGGSYGSMQVHNYDIGSVVNGSRGQTILAYNHWGAAGTGAGDVGLGTNTTTGGNNNPDWTFSNNAATYTVKNLQVLAQPVTATATVTIQVSNYGVSVGNVTQNEGNSGTSNFPFVVTLSNPSNDSISVNFVTSNGTAVSGSDYVATSGTVTIPAGQTTATFSIPVNGDADFELDENFYVVLSNPTNAVITDPIGTATITNDDVIPAISIGDFSKAEGNNASTTTFAFPVTLNHLSYQNVTVTFNTANGTATTADSDYVAVTGGSVTIPAGSLSGVANVTVNGDINIEPDETFTVALSAPVNGTLGRTPATGTIVNDDFPPVAVDDFFPSRFDQPMVVPARGVLANDTDPDAPSSALIAVIVSPPPTGTFNLAADGSFTYTPVAFAVGTTTFTYKAQDATGLQSNIATVTISLQTNAAPVTTPASVTVVEDTPTTFNFPVTDSTNDILTVTITRQPAHGTLTLLNNVSFPQYTYTPAQDSTAPDSFDFSVTDGVFTATGSISITITPVNDAPIATSASYEAGRNSFVDALLVGSDPADGTPVTFSIVTPPSNGSVTITNAVTGAFRYTPSIGFLGFDSFTFRTSDGSLTSAPATATIEVKPAPLFTSTPTVAPNPLLALQTLTGTSAVNNGSVVWNWGDGSSSSGLTATHIYATTGVYTLMTTVTATTGLQTTFTQTVFVGAPLSSGSAPGGIVVGGTSSGSGTGKISCNYVRREKSYYSGSLKGLAYPPTLTQAGLVGKNGILSIGVGSATPFVVPFTLSASGRAKSTGLPTMQINVKKGSFSFKAQSSVLTDLTEALGGTRQFTKTRTTTILNVPVTIQIGTDIFIVLTFQMKYTQSGKAIGTGGA